MFARTSHLAVLRGHISDHIRLYYSISYYIIWHHIILYHIISNYVKYLSYDYVARGRPEQAGAVRVGVELLREGVAVAAVEPISLLSKQS